METFDEILENLQRQQQAAMEQATIQRNPLAQLFAAWAKDVYRPAIQQRDIVAIQQAKVRLVDRFFDWYVSIPKKHRNDFFAVFEEAYHQLKVAELSLTPPMLFLPLPPPQPLTIIKKYNYAGFPIGETVVEDDEDE